MFKGQKCMRNDVEDFLCPFAKMNITQGANGSLSHRGTMANDVAGSGDRDPYYAPATVKCMAVYPDSGQSMWQSINPVRFANGNIDYATFMIAHDNSQNCYVGQIVNQGEQLGNMGDKGYATGIHCHIEIEQGSDTTWKQNEYGIWCFNNEVDTDDCYFVDSTEIINGMGGNWKYLKDVPVEEPKPAVDEDKVKIQELEKQLAEKNDIINNLTDGVTELTNTIIDKNEKIKTLENRIVEVTTERDKLKQEQPTLIFTAKRSDKYIINLYKDEKLYIK